VTSTYKNKSPQHSVDHVERSVVWRLNDV